MSFWKDVADLRRALKQQVAAGAGSKALIQAVTPAKSPPSPKKVAGTKGLQPQERMTAQEYRALMGL
jgi:hypothetical protein